MDSVKKLREPCPGGGFLQILPQTCVPPLLRPGMRRRAFPEIEHHPLKGSIRYAGGITVRETQEIRIAFLVSLLQHCRDEICPHQLQLPLITDPEGRVESDLLVVFPDHHQKEFVDGHDMVAVQKRHLMTELFIPRLLLVPCGHGVPDPLPELARRRPRKGHNQKSVQIHGVHRIQDLAEDSFNQHRSLAGAGCCRDKQAAAPCPDDFLLFVRPASSHMVLFLPCFWSSLLSGICQEHFCCQPISVSFRLPDVSVSSAILFQMSSCGMFGICRYRICGSCPVNRQTAFIAQ